MDEYLQPGRFIDSDHPEVIAFTERNRGASADLREQAVSLYYAVRDQVRYEPYTVRMTPECFRASTVVRPAGSVPSCVNCRWLPSIITAASTSPAIRARAASRWAAAAVGVRPGAGRRGCAVRPPCRARGRSTG